MAKKVISNEEVKVEEVKPPEVKAEEVRVEETSTVEPQPEDAQTEGAEKEVKDYVKELHARAAKAFKKAHENGTAIYQCEPDEIKKMYAIQEVYAMDGELKTATIPHPESVRLLQIMKDQGIEDPRIVSWKTREELGLRIAKGTKAVEIMKFGKDHKPYTVKCFFVAKTYAREGDNTLGAKLKLSPIEVTNHRGDVYVRNMVRYLKMRNDRGTLNADYYATMMKNAKESAHKSYEEIKPLYQEEDRRRDQILKTSLNTPAEKGNYLEEFTKVYKKHLLEKGARVADFFALREVISEKKWDEKTAKSVFNMISPNAPFDAVRKKSPLFETTLASVKKNLEKNQAKEQAAPAL